MKVSSRKFRALCISFMVIVVASLVSVGCEKLRSICICGTISTIILCVNYFHYKKNKITPFFLFFFSFSMFHFGQFYMYTFKIKYDYIFFHPFYARFVENKDIIISAKYSLMCITLIMFAGLITDMQSENFFGRFNDEIIKDKELLITGRIFFGISFPVSIVVDIMSAYVGINYGYEGYRNQEGILKMTLPYLGRIQTLSVFLIPALLLIYLNGSNKLEHKLMEVIMYIHILLYFMIGLRTVSMGLALVLILLKVDKLKNMTLKSKLKFFIVILCLAMTSNIVANVRVKSTQFDMSFSDEFLNAFKGFFGECGFSCYPLITLVHFCPHYVPIQHGKTYLYAALNFFPSFIDPTGKLYELQMKGTEESVFKFLNYNFGVGYSLAAESWYNFQWYGLIPIFVIGILLGKFLNDSKAKTGFNQYARYVMLYGMFTLPRRGISTFFNYCFYYIVCIYMVYYIVRFAEGSIHKCQR